MDFGTATGLSTQDIRLTVARIIRVAFGLLGVVALGIVLTGGVLWMTSAGNEEKLERAKKVLTNGVIGLTIMLLSFGITQFVISRLSQALYGQGTVTIATGGGTLPPGALPGGCVDPGGTVPFVCGISPTSGPVGAYVTIRGYRFGGYAEGQSSVRIGGVAASIVACGGGPNWADTLIVVEVPQLDAGRSHAVQVTAASGGVSGNPVVFGVTSDPVGPQIACIVPNQGPEGTIISVDGKNFGAERGSADVRFGGGVSLSSVTSWTDTAIGTTIPSGAQSGDVTVVRDQRTSNGYPVTVTCNAGNECSTSNCCVQNQCVEASACAPGGPPSTVGASCDGDAVAPACQPIACGGGLRCDLASCTCQEGPVITDVSPQTLVSVTDGTPYRSAEEVPAGTQTVTAPNGAEGNYVTIRGRGFGDAFCANDATRRCARSSDCADGAECRGVGRVFLAGGPDPTDDKVMALAECASAWSDTQVIAVVETAPIGPIRIETRDPQFFDQTDDTRGPAIEHFRGNTTLRPGVCAITPPSATIGASIAVAGRQFGDGAERGPDDVLLFGDQHVTTSAWSANAITATVPAIAEGPVEVRVRNDGELSNAVTFTRAPEPREPRIQEIVPDRGGGGQYVTIRGEHFGSQIGKVTFKNGTETYEVRPRFPDQCSVNWWKGNEITVRIPAGTGEWGPPTPPADFNAIGSYEVRVHAREGAAFRASNAVSFAVTTDQPTPGICAIIPASGPARTEVRIVGERFGGAVGAIQFFNGVAAAVGAGGADRAGNFQWADGLIRGLLVPVTAQTGPVRLWQTGQEPMRDDDPAQPGLQGNRGSNPVTFEVKDCRAGGEAACTEGQVCCGNGTCAASASACPSTGPNQGSFQWTFATGVVPKVPRVVESCDAFSPSPWDGQGKGAEACTNANIRVQFSASMGRLGGGGLDPDTARSATQVFRCGAGTNVAASAGGGFEGAGAALGAGWSVVEADWVTARREALPAGDAHGGTSVLRIEKRDDAHAKASGEPRPTDVPRDASPDRHFFAVNAPGSLITDTDGTTYTVRVFVRDPSPAANPNRRAGIVVGRQGGDTPTDPGWWQQVASEVPIDGTWRELAASMTFDAGPNARQADQSVTPGFVRLYVTGPPVDQPANPDDVYAAWFDDLEVVRTGDACAVREEVMGLAPSVASAGGRLQLASNILTIPPPLTGWAPGTWYEVILWGDDERGGAHRAFRSASDPQLRLDGDKDGQEGGNYRFRFRTRDDRRADGSGLPCAIASVATTPLDVLATQRGPARPTDVTAIDDPGLAHLRGDGIGDPAACFLLSATGMPWSWAAVQPDASGPYVGFGVSGAAEQLTEDGGRWCLASDDCAVITCATDTDCAPWDATPTCDVQLGRCVGTAFCAARSCSLDVAGENYFANTVTARAVRETPVSAVGVPQPATVRATVAPPDAPARSGESSVTVRFEKPRVVTVYPTASCAQACPNAAVVAIVNVELDTASVNSPSPNVRLYRCAQENCRRGELVAVDGVTATACPPLPAPADPCAGQRVGPEPQIIIEHPTLAPPVASYRVVLRGGVTGIRSAWGVPLENVNYANNDTGANDAYSWVFRTRAESCGVTSVEVSPNPLVLHVVGERASVAAIPRSSPDQCSPAGQPLDPETIAWSWAMTNASGVVARFTSVQANGTFPDPLAADTITRTTRGAGPSCSMQCLRPGSRRVPGICGNAVTEPGEECEPTADNASWCDAATCLRKGARPVADGGTCGNSAVDVGEECDGQRRCAVGGPKAGEGCTADADCSVTVGGVTASSACAFEFPAWCDAGSCLRKGAGFGSTCGNGPPAGDGEDCDDGNTTDGDGCSSRCLNEGTPRMYNATTAPDGILARCGDGVVADGQGGRPDGGEECDPGAVPRQEWTDQRCDYDRCVRIGARSIADDPPGTCGNGTIQAGEQCDDGAVGVCSDASTNAGTACASNADCTGGACEDRVPVDGDGCSASCLLEGSSLAWRNPVTGAPQPSQCGDGRSHTGEACDLGSTGGFPDPTQLVQAIGQGVPQNGSGTQATPITARVEGVEGRGEVELQCGFTVDAQCSFPSATPPVSPTDYGVDRIGCCRLRPEIGQRTPAPNEQGVCRNARITVRFSEPLDPGSVGAVTDLATGQTTTRGAVLERCKAGTACASGSDADWEATTATPTVIATLDGERLVGELHFTLSAALDAATSYRVRVFDASDDTAAVSRSIRSADGVRLGEARGGNVWTFTTGAQICTVSRIQVDPPSYLLQRLEDRAKLRAEARTLVGDAPIVSIPGAYAWGYAWGTSAADVAGPLPTPLAGGEDAQFPCGANERCAFRPAEPTKSGDALGLATATITANAFGTACTSDNAAQVCGQGRSCAGGRCVGESFTGRSMLRALICENPWPAVRSGAGGPATWSPRLITGENVSLAYCRDSGSRKVCRTPGQVEAADATTCATDANCASIAGTKCLLAQRDDLPEFSTGTLDRTIVTTVCKTSADAPEDGSEQPCAGSCPAGLSCVPAIRDRLRRELLFLPRGLSGGSNVHYCSVSGERCDETLPGTCPVGEFCRPGQDAIGLRFYQNRAHVSAGRWYAQQGFTEATAPVEVDQYRGVQAGRSTYLNIANVGSIFTNLLVLSYNDAAVPETQEILRQVLSGLRFTTTLTTENLRMCSITSPGRGPVTGLGRCSGSGSTCLQAGGALGCPTGERCEPASCTADHECQLPPPPGVTFNGTCVSPKDKLARDVRRLEDLNEIRLALEAFGRSTARCSVSPQSCDPAATLGQSGACPAGETCLTLGPELAAGTFIPGTTTSRWPSWQAELGTAIGLTPLPVDPVNVFGGACSSIPANNTGYDQATCWNQQEQLYMEPPESYLYRYQRQPNGQWSLRARFEFAGTTPPPGQPVREWSPAPPSTIGTIPSGTQSFGVGGRCGDGVQQAGEACDPPGATQPLVGTCTVKKCNGSSPLCDTNDQCPSGQTCQNTGVTNGSRVQTCSAACQWVTGFCASQCGNAVRDGTEQCDVGSTGGRVPPGHPVPGVVPGITTAGQLGLTANSQYECSTSCTWTGGRCGDGTVQSAYGEQCDGTANVATTRSQSSPTTQYGCTAPTAASPCKVEGGFCGDGVVADGGSDVRACRSAEGVWGREPCAADSDCRSGETCVVRVRRATPNRGEQCDGSEIRSCIQGTGELPDPTDWNPNAAWTLMSGLLPGVTDTEASIWFPIDIRDQSGLGDLRLTLQTSNDGADLSNLTRETIQANLPSGRTINDYNPGGAQGGAGLYHHITLSLCTSSSGGGCTPKGDVWVRAGTTPQFTTHVLEDVDDAAGTGLTRRYVKLKWENDWSGGGLNAKLKLHSVRVEGVQSRTCGAPGSATACAWAAGWGPCAALAAACGNGIVEDGQEGRPNLGEQCDDGGKGRCTNDLSRECRQDSECGTGNRCDQNLDACTSACRRATCGDAFQLAPTCTAGPEAKLNTPCRSNADCGPGGACSTEACDLGVSNWRSTCTGAGDQRCVPNALCEYGRTCNYCTTACAIATRQGGFCGDRIKNGPEECDFIAGTNQCDGLSGTARTTCEARVGVENLTWNKEVCNAACTAKCPPAYQPQSAKFGDTGDAVEVDIQNGQEKVVRFPGCRLLGGLRFDVALDDSVGRMNVIIVTDRSGSMDGGPSGGPVGGRPGSRMRNAIDAIANDGGLIDRLFAGRGANRVRIGLVSYSTGVTTDTPGVSTDATTGATLVDSSQRQALKDKVRTYQALGGTATNDGLTRAAQILLNDTTAGADVIVLMSDGAPDSGQDPANEATSFKSRSNSYLYTVAFTGSTSLKRTMCTWSSDPASQCDPLDPNRRYSVAGTNVQQLYTALGNAVSSITFTVFRNNQSFSSANPKPVTTVSFDGNDVAFSTAGLEQQCAVGGTTDTKLKIRADFFGASGAKVTLRDPNANICTGPPWRP